MFQVQEKLKKERGSFWTGKAGHRRLKERFKTEMRKETDFKKAGAGRLDFLRCGT